MEELDIREQVKQEIDQIHFKDMAEDRVGKSIVGEIEPIIVTKEEEFEESDTDFDQYDMTKIGSSRKTPKKKEPIKRNDK